jgi:hypothetical protein
MKNLKINNTKIYSSFEEMKESRLNRPFNKKKYEKYMKDLKEFHKIIKKSDNSNKKDE